MCRTVPGFRSPLEGLGPNPYPAEMPEGRTLARAPEGLNPCPVMHGCAGAGGTCVKPVPGMHLRLEGCGANPYPAQVPEGRTRARAPEG